MNSNMRGKMGGIGRGRKPIAQENTPAPGGSIPPAQQNGFGSHRREFGEQNGPSSDRFERPQNDRFGSSAGGGFGGRGGFGGDDNSSQSKFGGGGGGSGFGESNRGFGSSDRNNDGGGFGGGRGGGRGGGGGGRGCHKCGEEGHFARECTNEGGGQGSGGFGGGGGGFGGNRGFGGGSNNDDGGRSGGGFGGGSFGGDRGGSNFGGDRGGSNFGGGGRGGDAGDRPRGCFNCGEEGHRKSECTQPMKERAGGGGGGGCFNCGVDGHRAADCTEPRKPREGEDGERKIANYEPKDLTGDDLFRYGRYDTGINFEHYDDIEVKVNIGGKSTAPKPIQSFQDVDMDDQILRSISRVGYKKPTPFQKSFQDMDMDGQILRNISRVGYKKPTPIQKYAIPIILEGHDVMACAQTGSGKTAAFLLPIFAKMYHNPQELRNASGSTRQAPTVLIISPTRELADQTYQECQKLGNETEIKPIRMYGQIRMDVQSRYLMSGCNVVCGCSGRIMDMLKRGLMTLENCRYLVLDEADKMLDMGFENDIRSIAQQYDMPSKEERQTLMFSATFPDQIQQMAKEFLKDRYAFITVGVIGAANTDITQSVIDITSTSKPKMDILKEMLLAEMQEKGAPSRTLVFVERKRNADVVAVYLSDAQIKAVSVHGDRYQKERQEAVDMFKSGDCVVLVATDVAARGLDIPNVEHVINFDLPKEEEVYVHRIGRTGRLGNPGRATSFYNDGENANFRTWLVHAMSEANQTVPEFLQENQSISSRFGETSSFAPPGNSFGGGFASAGSGFASDGASGFGGGFGDSANSKGWD